MNLFILRSLTPAKRTFPPAKILPHYGLNRKSALLKPVLRLLLVLMSVIGLEGCDTLRILWWNKAGVDDYRKFPAATVKAFPTDQSFEFERLLSPSLPLIMVSNGNQAMPLDSFLRQRGTTAWLVLQADTIRAEVYSTGWDTSSLLTSFSVAKSFVATLVGIAIGEGTIRSVDQPVTDFLPWLEKGEMHSVTLRDLLNMRAALDFDEGYTSLFSPMPKLYYGRRLSQQVRQIGLKSEPGQQYEYQSMSTQLLSMALEAATGQSVASYLESRLWIPLGMESDALWSRASQTDTTIKSFCCLNATGRDYLRFGRLWMNKGMWQGKRLIPETWITETLADTLDSKDSRGYAYSHQWRILPDGALFAKGVMGQYLWINPHRQIVIARFGTTDANTDWIKIFRQTEESFLPVVSKKRL